MPPRRRRSVLVTSIGTDAIRVAPRHRSSWPGPAPRGSARPREPRPGAPAHPGFGSQLMTPDRRRALLAATGAAAALAGGLARLARHFSGPGARAAAEDVRALLATRLSTIADGSVAADRAMAATACWFSTSGRPGARPASRKCPTCSAYTTNTRSAGSTVVGIGIDSPSNIRRFPRRASACRLPLLRRRRRRQRARQRPWQRHGRAALHGRWSTETGACVQPRSATCRPAELRPLDRAAADSLSGWSTGHAIANLNQTCYPASASNSLVSAPFGYGDR